MNKKLGVFILLMSMLVISIASADVIYESTSDPLDIVNNLLNNNHHSREAWDNTPGSNTGGNGNGGSGNGGGSGSGSGSGSGNGSGNQTNGNSTDGSTSSEGMSQNEQAVLSYHNSHFTKPDFTARIVGANELPATDSDAVGRGLFIINKEKKTLKYDIYYRGLDARETESHIHGPAYANDTAGVLLSLQRGNHKSGTWHYPDYLEDDLLAGKLYVNIHSSKYPEGEIRGQILPVE